MARDTHFQNNHTPSTTPLTATSKRPRNRRKRSATLDWLTEPYNHARGETSLWVAVITQAMMDALSRSRSADAIYQKQEATRWLTGNSPDFIMVCLLGGFEPGYIRRKVKRTLATPSPWRAEPGMGRRYLERKRYREKLKSPKAPPVEGPASTVIPGPWPMA